MKITASFYRSGPFDFQGYISVNNFMFRVHRTSGNAHRLISAIFILSNLSCFFFFYNPTFQKVVMLCKMYDGANPFQPILK